MSRKNFRKYTEMNKVRSTAASFSFFDQSGLGNGCAGEIRNIPAQIKIPEKMRRIVV
jgi:hypothetical protein